MSNHMTERVTLPFSQEAILAEDCGHRRQYILRGIVRLRLFPGYVLP